MQYASNAFLVSLRRVRERRIARARSLPLPFKLSPKIFWWKASAARWEHGFFRTTAYSAAFSPKYAIGTASHIALGMPVVGMLEKPHSERSSTNLLAWDHASYSEWDAYAPHTRFSPLEREALLDQDLIAWLPQLGGDKFVIRNRFHFVPSLRIDQPLVPTEVLRAVSSQHGTLGAVADHVRARPQLALPAPPIAPDAEAYHAPMAKAAYKAPMPAFIAPKAAPAPVKATVQT